MKKGGFTLIELLIVISIMAVLGGLSFPFVSSYQNRNSLDVATNTLAQTYRRAQSLSMAAEGDSGWGVYIGSPDIIIFRGSSFSGRDTSYDEVFRVNDGVTISGTTEVIFNKISGLPVATGSTNLSKNGDSRTVTINEEGIVGY